MRTCLHRTGRASAGVATRHDAAAKRCAVAHNTDAAVSCAKPAGACFSGTCHPCMLSSAHKHCPHTRPQLLAALADAETLQSLIGAALSSNTWLSASAKELLSTPAMQAVLAGAASSPDPATFFADALAAAGIDVQTLLADADTNAWGVVHPPPPPAPPPRSGGRRRASAGASISACAAATLLLLLNM